MMLQCYIYTINVGLYCLLECLTQNSLALHSENKVDETLSYDTLFSSILFLYKLNYIEAVWCMVSTECNQAHKFDTAVNI